MRDRRDRGKAAGCFLRTLLVLALLVVLVALFATFYTGAEPNVAVQSKLKGIGRRTPMQIRIEDPQRVSKVTVEVVQGADVKKVAERELEVKSAWAFGGVPPVEMTVDVGRETVQGLRSGTAKVRVTAEREGTWLRRPAPAVAEVELPVRLAPPTLQVQSTFHYVRQGGSELVVYRVGEGAVRDGVQAGSWWFPGFPMPGSNDKQQRFALFAVPFDMGDPSGVRLVAIDDVGNRAESGFIDKFTPSPPRSDTIELNEKFMNKVVSEIISQSPEVADQGNLLANYLEINRNLRKKNAATLIELGSKSAKQFLWNQPFLPMINAAIKAAFADQRTYVLNGKPVDQQVHLGFDLASVERDAIRASNSGRVVLARYFGIYGNAVVIDHGYGLQTLYGHLSSIGVKEGDMVKRDQEVGRSGQTGLAGGDHLHFTTLLQGLAVNPVEWWDPHWIQDRIARKLGPVLPYKG
jgi:hypothetical protein